MLQSNHNSYIPRGLEVTPTLHYSVITRIASFTQKALPYEMQPVCLAESPSSAPVPNKPDVALTTLKERLTSSPYKAFQLYTDASLNGFRAVPNQKQSRESSPLPAEVWTSQVGITQWTNSSSLLRNGLLPRYLHLHTCSLLLSWMQLDIDGLLPYPHMISESSTSQRYEYWCRHNVKVSSLNKNRDDGCTCH